METLETIAARIETTEEIHGIVRTMKSLSAASIRSYERAVEAIGEYERTVTLGMQAVLRTQGAGRLRARPAKGRRLVIVLGSDRGLCGRFNDRVAGAARPVLGGGDTFLAVAGLRAAARLEAQGHAADIRFALPGSVAGLTETVRVMAARIDRETRHGRAGAVTLVFNRRQAQALAEPVQRQLLPVSDRYLDALATRPWPSRSLPAHRADGDRLFSWLLHQHLFVMVYRALAESLASEHAARLAAMQGAERNIEERHADLRADYRHKRQESVTRELLDLVSGFESARGDDASA
ncbi:F0F1 ATP synthase subunit gamma [Roseovarius salinarum]|uniref:F0F1 ATP synthase subunit gamma n=1 Tax=Roseovarius salinarum TaxID=1981892 RepID=UPI000C326E25|nr:F0F1 ATP synthase subunit gamma [Roseovarius salinarum]